MAERQCRHPPAHFGSQKTPLTGLGLAGTTLNHLVQIFAKAPLPGYAKTRLIPALGAEGATHLHGALLEHCLKRFSAAFPVQLWCAPDVSQVFFAHCRACYGVDLCQQAEGDLGRRMAFALRAGLKNAPRVLLTGSDCPALDAEYLYRALEALEKKPLVIAPAEDGGYVLIGVRETVPNIFSAMPWSTPRLMAATRMRLRGLGLSWRELPPLWDVDDARDLPRLHEEIMEFRYNKTLTDFLERGKMNEK